jgi:hypothetical protein
VRRLQKKGFQLGLVPHLLIMSCHSQVQEMQQNRDVWRHAGAEPCGGRSRRNVAAACVSFIGPTTCELYYEVLRRSSHSLSIQVVPTPLSYL